MEYTSRKWIEFPPDFLNMSVNEVEVGVKKISFGPPPMDNLHSPTGRTSALRAGRYFSISYVFPYISLNTCEEVILHTLLFSLPVKKRLIISYCILNFLGEENIK